MRSYVLGALPVLLLVLAGCEQTEQTYSLNPDGTGKVLYRATFPLDVQAGPGSGNKSQTDEEKVEAAKKSVLGHSAGVEAWSDVSCAASDDGLIVFKGTAYFRDLNTLKIGSLSGQKSSGKRLEYQKTAKGYRLTMAQEQEGDGPGFGTPEKKASADNKPKTKEALAKEVLRARTSWKYMRHMVGLSLANAKTEFNVVTPVPAKTVQGFTKSKDGYSFVFDGAKMFQAMDEIFQKSDAELAALIGQGTDLKDSQFFGAYVAKKLGFDPQAGPAFETEAAKPLFDFAAEVAAARKNFPALNGNFASPEKIATAAGSGKGDIKGVRVSNVQRSFPANENDFAGTSITVEVAFGVPVTCVNKVEVTEATGQDGKALDLKQVQCNSNLNAEENSASVSCHLPGNTAVAELKRLAGTVNYSCSAGSKLVDLGLLETKKGAKGSAMDAEIDDIQDGWLHFKVTGKKEQFKGLKLFTPDGKPYDAKPFGINEWEGKIDVTLRPVSADGEKWPAKLQFKAELFTETKAFTAPWSVQHISLPVVGQ